MAKPTGTSCWGSGSMLPARKGWGRIVIAGQDPGADGETFTEAHLLWKSPQEDIQALPAKTFRSGITFSVPFSNRLSHVL